MEINSADKTITALAADRLISAHDGDVALLYIYMLRTGSDDTEKAAGALCRTLSQIDEAAEKLRRMDILPLASRDMVPAPADELPEYTTQDITRRASEDFGFSFIVSEAQRVLGHMLSTPDLKKLFGIYDYLRLPPEVIAILLNYCVTTSKGRLPSMRFIEKEAFRWADNEILTPEQADAYIKASSLRRSTTVRILSLLGISDRKPSATEQKYIGAWLDMGFPEEVIEIAYDRTVTNTGSLKWAYMHKILQSWHQKGLHTAAEVEAKDSRSVRAAKPASAVPKVDLNALRAGLDDMEK